MIALYCLFSHKKSLISIFLYFIIYMCIVISVFLGEMIFHGIDVLVSAYLDNLVPKSEHPF